MNITDRAKSLQRTHPHISAKHARYLYRAATDLDKRASMIKVWIVMWADDGRAALHHTTFSKKRPMSVSEWASWLQVHAPGVLVDNVMPYVNRTFGSSWNIDRIFGWHFTRRAHSQR